MRDPLDVFGGRGALTAEYVKPAVDPGRNGKGETVVFRPRTIGRRMDEIEPCEIRWLWRNRIPRARLTAFVGDGGAGKSFLSLAIAAGLSRGAAWPDQPGSGGEPGVTVLLNAEDCPDDTIRVRLDRAGADCRMIHIVEAVQRTEDGEPGYFSLIDDLRALERKIEETAAKLCIVDPLGAYLTGTDSHRDASVRQALGPLAGMASRTGCAVLTILHTNKRTDPKKVRTRDKINGAT